ncbi:embryonic protein DC-8-like protein [Tanacetum coccineum]
MLLLWMVVNMASMCGGFDVESSMLHSTVEAVSASPGWLHSMGIAFMPFCVFRLIAKIRSLTNSLTTGLVDHSLHNFNYRLVSHKVKAAATKNYTVDKAATTKDYTLDKVDSTKDYSVDKAKEGKDTNLGLLDT